MSFRWANEWEREFVIPEGGFKTIADRDGYRTDGFQEFLDAGGVVLPYWTKDKALDFTKRGIETYGQQELEKPFWYEPLQHNMHLDLDFTLKVVVKNDDKVYTWKTADKEADGETPVYVQLDKHQLKEMYDTFVDHGEHLFNVQEMHKNAVIALHLDPEATADDIRNYDYTTGW